MIEFAEWLHYGTIALSVAINSVGVGIGEGITSSAALHAINKQPQAKNEISRIAILGTALIETAAIMGVSISIILLIGTKNEILTPYAALAEVGIALAICLSGFVIGIVSALPAKEACLAVARQPFFGEKILRFMLITQSVIQTPIIFDFIIAMFIRNQALDAETFSHSLKLIAGGLCIGLGTIGPALGLGTFARTAVRGLGINRSAYTTLMTFMFISQAIIETPVVFALVTSLLILVSNVATPVAGIATLAAAICMGLGTIGPGSSSGKTAAAACHQIALNPEIYHKVANVSLFGQGLIDTCAIYAFLIAIIMVLFQ